MTNPKNIDKRNHVQSDTCTPQYDTVKIVISKC